MRPWRNIASIPSVPVLVVHDPDMTIQFIGALLRHLGFVDVDDANSGAEALTKMRAKRYELVISDWHTEPMTGYDFLCEVRGDARFNRTPFILVGESKSENVIAAKKAGVSSYVVPPFDAETLKSKIEVAFETRKVPLPERQQTVSASHSLQSDEASVAAPSSDAASRKFTGRFTSSA